MTNAAGQLTLVRGIVTATKDRMASVNVDRKTGHGRVNTTPELWVRDESGTEHRYSGNMFDAAQPGHDVAVVIKRSSGKPIAFANFTGNFVSDAKELNTSTSFGSILGGTLLGTIILTVPGLFIWATLAEPFGLLDVAFSTIGFQIYLIILGASVFAGVQIWAKGYRERTDAIIAEIDQLLLTARDGQGETKKTSKRSND